MRIEDLMTRSVLTVGPETSLKDVARLLSENRISGAPVCGADGRVLGVVSEGDILSKEQNRAERGRGPVSWLLERDDGPTAKVVARTAEEAMTTPAITVEPALPVAQAARLMIDRDVNRLPVVDGEKLVGILTRADLVRAFHRSDEEIEREISEDVLVRTLWISPDRLTISVEDGEVLLRGQVETRTQAELVVAYVRRVPGVVGVRSEVSWSVDDLERRAPFRGHEGTR